jgi:hypothetical protein
MTVRSDARVAAMAELLPTQDKGQLVRFEAVAAVHWGHAK